jgi:predicted outer membrane repeat protein
MKQFHYYTAIILSIILNVFINSQNISAQTITVEGDIVEDTDWIVDSVIITGDINILNGVTLTLVPNTYVEFQGHYKINVQGCITATGTDNSPIIFTVNDTTGFTDTTIFAGGWQGIHFDSTAETNTGSKFDNCIFEYGKAVGESESERNGGVFFINNCSKLSISKSRFRNNIAVGSGGAIYCNNNSSPIISGNIITHNTAYYNGGGLAVKTNCSPQITGNTISYNFATELGGGCYSNDTNVFPSIIANMICNNRASNGGGLYDGNPDFRLINNIICNNYADIGGAIYNGLTGSTAIYVNNTICNNNANQAGGVQCNSSSLQLVNNIIFGNTALSGEMEQIGVGMGAPIVTYCNVQDGYGGLDNIVENPSFIAPTYESGTDCDATNADWSIDPFSSACINTGKPNTAGLGLPATDFAGNDRIIDGRIDIGAFEAIIPAAYITTKHANEMFYIFPNPCRGIVNFEFLNNEKTNFKINVLNSYGQQIFKKQYLNTSYIKDKIDLSAFPNGIYFVKLKNGNSVFIKKMILL